MIFYMDRGKRHDVKPLVQKIFVVRLYQDAIVLCYSGEHVVLNYASEHRFVQPSACCFPCFTLFALCKPLSTTA